MKTKRPYAQVMPIAEKLVEFLGLFCDRIEIAGSLRREKAMIGDIEIVAVPILDRDLLGEPTGLSAIDHILPALSKDITKNGQKQKQFMYTSGGVEIYQVDLFLQPDPATWGVNFLLRTGSADFSRRMVTPKHKGGYMPAGYQVKGARVWHLGEKVETPEEEDVFRLWGMDVVEPKERR
jgi:DNA polymerase/3'-5' exonuclease PolX